MNLLLLGVGLLRIVFWVLWFIVLLLFSACSGVKFVGLSVPFEFGVLWFGDLAVCWSGLKCLGCFKTGFVWIC